ncbi:cysteine hydrolase family protein [Terribacillus saccharophilus]|uniref:Isochorismatase n=1 Tax=Terribacillus saccharophilus TaxID=361277 RepID=A0ABX4GTS0_9BACI|nr:isochorismatase family cysteine hydrolase [Terribacillus saccharophilus]PAD33714.1 isochorismatase [Terribacillus saccharophilus]PAD94525.1 isochorismatase [Terribacillus saccharophilus]PAD98255.1 isochorismatase [Terribacillus saccharophilus]
MSDKKAVLFIDVFNTFDFPGGDKLLENTKEILPNWEKLRKKAKENDWPVIFVNDHYGIWQDNFKKIADYCRNEDNKEIIDSMMPQEDDYFLLKPKHSAFFQTSLPSLLKDLDCERVILAGVAGNICVIFSANDAHMREFKLDVPRNCVASNTKEQNEDALRVIEATLNANTDSI